MPQKPFGIVRRLVQVSLLLCAFLPESAFAQARLNFIDPRAPQTSPHLPELPMQTAMPRYQQVRPEDLQAVVGSWEGNLSYLDYSSGKIFSMPANIEIGQLGKTPTFLYFNTFPEEMEANWTDTIRISEDGQRINDEWVRFNVLRPDGIREIVTEVLGTDGNDEQPAMLRYSYLISPDIFVRHKEVQYVGTEEWFVRHEYRYTKRAKTLSAAQLSQDLAILRTTWEQLHPGLYRYNTPAQIDGYFKALQARLAKPTEQQELFLLLSQLNARLHCGHSLVSPYNNRRILRANLFSRVFLPVLFKVIDDRLVVTHHMLDDSPLREGDIITAINGIPAARILDSLLTVSAADGLNGRAKQCDNISISPDELALDDYGLFDIYFPLFFKSDLNSTTYTLELQSSDGKPYRLACEGLGKAQRLARFEKKYGILPVNEATWSLKAIDAQTALFRVGDFATYNWKFDVNQYLDSIFSAIQTAGYQNLIIDVRGNEGGSDATRDALLSYLTPKPIACLRKGTRLLRYTSVPDSLRPYLSAWDDSFYGPRTGLKARKGGWYEQPQDGGCTTIPSHPKHFTGKLFLLTDVTNSSATFLLAEAFRTHQLGTIVGETTGGTRQGINGGELFFFTLPNSRIEMDLPLIWQAPTKKQPDEGIHPDHLVKTTPADIAAHRDPQLQHILENLIAE